LLGRLFAAANNHVDLSDDRATKIGPISDLQNEGCDLELDILPIIKGWIFLFELSMGLAFLPACMKHRRAVGDR
jgi:hypothetical protein